MLLSTCAGMWLGLGASSALQISCLIELDHQLACGDGYVDTMAGEECDPQDPARAHESACAKNGFSAGKAGCDPTTCQIVVSAAQCSVCGDGQATGNEPCDGVDLRGLECPAGGPGLRCKEDCTLDVALCETCGDSVFDPMVEECERKIACNDDGDCPTGICNPQGVCALDGGGGLATPVSCETLEPPAGSSSGYSSGQVFASQCTEACTLDRSTCNFCGNGQLDGSYNDIGPDGTYVPRAAEICDGDKFDPDALSTACQDLCTNGSGTVLELRCEAQCGDSCQDISASEADIGDPEALSCCVLGGEKCNPQFPCCFALDNPELADQACLPVETPEGIVIGLVCRTN